MAQKKITDSKFFPLVILLIFHFAYRFFLLSINAFPFNSDEAIVGLMAKHIIEGENFLFFYGQSYMGSLDAYLVALGFLIFGKSVWVIRLIQLLLYGITISIVYLFANDAFKNKKIAILSALFLVFPPVLIVLYTTVTLGGYGEAILLGVFSFYIAENIVNRNIGTKIKILLAGFLGFLLGFGLFVNPISLTMIIPAIMYLIYKYFLSSNFAEFGKKILPILFIGFLIGSILFWYSLLVTNGMSVIQEIGGSAVAVENETFLQKSFSHFISFILFGPSVIFGLRPPWSVEWLGKLLIPIVLFFWFLVLYFFIAKKQEKSVSQRIWFISLISMFVIGGFIFTSFGVDPSGRYFLPMVFPISIIFGYAVVKFNNKFVTYLSIGVLLYHVYGTYISAVKDPYITTQFYVPAQVDHTNIDQLIQFLNEQGEFYGYSNYWVSYPVAFLSDEKITIIPELPYHPDLRFTDRDNRISKYNEMIKDAEAYFYITTNNPALDELLIKNFQEKNVKYQLKVIDDYHIYFDLSKKINPQELGIKNEYK